MDTQNQRQKTNKMTSTDKPVTTASAQPENVREYATHKSERVEVIGEDSSDKARALILSGRGFTSYVPKTELRTIQAEKPTHSPLPWSEEGGIITAGINPGQPYIADCRFGPAGHRNANAKLIVRAVNHADALAECLRIILDSNRWFDKGREALAAWSKANE